MLAFTTLKELMKKEGEGLSIQTDSDSRRGNDFKLKAIMFMLGVRDKLFTQRLLRHWNRLAGEIVDA